MAWQIEATGTILDMAPVVADLEERGEIVSLEETADHPGEYAVRVQRDGWRCPYCWLLVGGRPADHVRQCHGIGQEAT